MRPTAFALALTLALAAAPAAATPEPEAWGFAKIAEWPLGTGENALGCRPADPDDPPNAEYLWGAGPMLLAPGRLADPVNRRQIDVAKRESFPYLLEKDPGLPERYASLPGGELLADPGRPTVYAGETLEARFVAALDSGDVIGVNRIVDGEARTLFLHLDPFGAVRDLFELPVLPWPRRIVFADGGAAFLRFRAPDGKSRALSPYETAGVIELHASPGFAARIANRPALPGAIPVAATPLSAPPHALSAAAYDPVADAWLLAGPDGASFAGKPVVHPPLSAALAAMTGGVEACFGDDGRFHLFAAEGTAGVSFGLSPEGAVEPFRSFTLERPPFATGRLSHPRVTRTGEILLDDLAAGRTLRFLPDGRFAGMKDGVVGAASGARGVWAAAAGGEPSHRPILEFDLALNFQRRFAGVFEPGGRVGTVRILGLDTRHRLHLVRFRDGAPLQEIFDQETGRRLAGRPLAFAPAAGARPVGTGFFLRHDGAPRALLHAADGTVTRLDWPPFD